MRASPAERYARDAERIFAGMPEVALVTLFGSVARGTERATSDVDLLVWLEDGSSWTRHDVWNAWDANAGHLHWNARASLIVRALSRRPRIDTLLLDFPEEHVVVHDPRGWARKLRDAVVKWRALNGSYKVPSFGGTHGWIYSDTAQDLSLIDFGLELDDVA